jgi:cyclophilin family peptidyl-prolyl cis-trans isomerase
MFTRIVLPVWLLAAAGLWILPGLVVAQDQPPAAAAPPLTPEQAAAVWNEAEQQIGQIEKRLGEIQQAFPTAQPDEKTKLRTEAIALIERIKQQFRAIGKVSPQVYPLKAQAAGADNTQPLQLVQQAMGLAYTENRYVDAAQIAEAILAVNPQDAVALNVDGVAHFATHDFGRAVEILERAEKDQLLIPDLGGQYLETARAYVQYWEAEQQLRAKEAAATGEAQLPRVLLKTSRGEIVLELFEDQAPNTVANFISLVEKGFYDGSPFHRVISNFMAQTGMPGKKFGGTDGPGYTIECECYRPDARRHFAGSLSMAHAGKDTGGSQFFITHLPTPHLDREIRPESVHTVFGRVVSGMEVVAAIEQGDTIETATVLRKRNHPYVPQTNPERP